MSPYNHLNVLVIEDDADARTNLRDILELNDYRVETAATAAEALNRTDWSALSAIVLDRRLPDASADELLPKLRRLAPEAAVIIVTGYADIEGALAALRQGAADYILKPLNPNALLASLERVAERRRLALAKERSEAAFRHLVEAAECMIVILRPDQSILYFSPFAERLTGYPAAEVRGQAYGSLFSPETERSAVADEFTRILGGQITRGFESSVVCRDRSQRWMVWNARLLDDHEGGPAILAVGQDITKLKQAQDRALQTERLAAIGEVVAGLAHESRNALQRSQACLEMLSLQVRDRPEALDLIARLQSAQEDLHRLFEDVRSYAAPIKLERRSCDLAEVWREAWANLELAREHKAAWLVESFDSMDLHCSVDAFRLGQVFRNVFDNALAAGERPVKIEMLCSEDRCDGRPAVRIAVRDNGPGLSDEQRRKIFEPFYTTKTKGTGLGMAICKRIVEAHGGQIEIGDGPVRGTEIVLTLPQELAMNKSLRIAVADDEPDMQDYFRTILPSLGHAVVSVARTGRELVEQCRASHPDLVITDIKMPDMDGIDAATEIYRDFPVPVILVSAYHDSEFIRRAETDHIMAYLVKPIKQADLEPAIAIAMRRFAQFQELRKEATGLRQALEDRKIIERAKGVLMKKANLDEHDAFRRLQKLASDKNRKLVEIAQMILTAEEAFGSPGLS